MSFLPIIIALLLLSCSSLQAQQAGEEGPARASGRRGVETPAASRKQAVDHRLLDRILRENVHGERVDYLVIRRDHLQELETYLSRMDRVRPAGLDRNERLAFFINLYNASMIRAVIERLRADWTPRAEGFQVFKDPVVRLQGRRISLDHLEHEIIRKRFEDPRIHAALVCAAVSCPPILPGAWSGRHLQRTLEERMRAFVRDERRNRVERSRGRVLLSRIFDWYAADFGGSKRVLAYVDRYHPENLKGLRVAFRDYSWDLNIARPANGRFVRVVRRTPLEKEGLVFEKGQILALEKEAGKALRVRVPGSRDRSVLVPATAVTSYP